MVVTLEEIKNYLRIDFDEDDGLLLSLLSTSERMCMDILRTDERDTAAEHRKCQDSRDVCNSVSV